MNRHSRKKTRSRVRPLSFHQLEQRRVLNGAGFGHWDWDGPVDHFASNKPAFEGESIAADVRTMKASAPQWFEASDKANAPRAVRFELVISGRRFEIIELVGEGEGPGPRFGESHQHRAAPDKIPDQVPDQLTIPIQDTAKNPLPTNPRPSPISTVNPNPLPSKPISTDPISNNSIATAPSRTSANNPLPRGLNAVAMAGAPLDNSVPRVMGAGLNDQATNVIFQRGLTDINLPTSNAANTNKASGTVHADVRNVSNNSRSKVTESTQFGDVLFSNTLNADLPENQEFSFARTAARSGHLASTSEGALDTWTDLAFERIQAWSSDSVSLTTTMVDTGSAASEPRIRTAWSLWVAAGACLGVAVLESWFQSRKKEDETLILHGGWLVGVGSKFPSTR